MVPLVNSWMFVEALSILTTPLDTNEPVLIPTAVKIPVPDNVAIGVVGLEAYHVNFDVVVFIEVQSSFDDIPIAKSKAEAPTES